MVYSALSFFIATAGPMVYRNLSAHLTENIFSRYNTVRSQDLEHARAKLEGSAQSMKSGAVK
jgi:hypothetical protein